METRANEESSFSILPLEMIMTIFSFLSAKEQDAVALTCSLFYNAVFQLPSRQHSSLDYTKRREDRDKTYHVSITPSDIIPMTNESIIVVEKFAYKISLVELNEPSSVTTIYHDDKPSEAVPVFDYTKVSNHLFAYILCYDLSDDEKKYRLMYLWDTQLKKPIKEWKVPNSDGYHDNLLLTNNNQLVQSHGNQINFWNLNDLSKDTPIKTITLSDYHYQKNDRSALLHQIDSPHFGKNHPNSHSLPNSLRLPSVDRSASISINRLFINQQDQFVIIDDKEHLFLCDENGQVLKRMDNITINPRALQLLPNGNVFGVHDRYEIKFCVIDLQTGEVKEHEPIFTQPLQGPRDQFVGGYIQPIARTSLIAMSASTLNEYSLGSGVTIWDTNTMTCISVLKEYILKYAVMPNNQIMTLRNSDRYKAGEYVLHQWDFEPLALKPTNEKIEPIPEKAVSPEAIPSEKKPCAKSSLPGLSFFNKKLHQAGHVGRHILHKTSKALSRDHQDKHEKPARPGNS